MARRKKVTWKNFKDDFKKEFGISPEEDKIDIPISDDKEKITISGSDLLQTIINSSSYPVSNLSWHLKHLIEIFNDDTYFGDHPFLHLYEYGFYFDKELPEEFQINLYILENYKVMKKYFQHGLIGKSLPYVKMLFDIEQCVNNTHPVLLIGETGTGKEVVARAIHNECETTKGKKFIAINCGAFTRTLLQSQLFGHEKGSFTDAIKQKIGSIELAGGGTLFLDEITTITEHTQVQLLRYLNDNKFERLGGEGNLIPSNTRIIVASNEPYKKIREDLREDFFYRIYTTIIEIHNLWNRTEDIPILSWYFLEDLIHNLENTEDLNNIKVSNHLLFALLRVKLSGNIRQLRSYIHGALNKWIFYNKSLKFYRKGKGVGWHSPLHYETYYKRLFPRVEEVFGHQVIKIHSKSLKFLKYIGKKHSLDSLFILDTWKNIKTFERCLEKKYKEIDLRKIDTTKQDDDSEKQVTIDELAQEFRPLKEVKNLYIKSVANIGFEQKMTKKDIAKALGIVENTLNKELKET